MLPDLGKHADTVLSAYVISIVLLVGLVTLSFWQSHRARIRLSQIESRRISAPRNSP